MKSARGIVLYVGKAKNLRRRLSSYFHKKKHRRRIGAMVKQVRQIEVIIVRNETESLILENNLIKRYKPKYNRRLKSDNSSYPYIVMTDEPLPRFVPYRKRRRDYNGVEQVMERKFGPYLSVHIRDTVLAFVNESYGLRTCEPLEDRACLLYHMHKCSAICEGKVSKRQYMANVRKAAKFLEASNQTRILHAMQKQMLTFAEDLKFERAQHVKTQIEALEHALINQVAERDTDRNQVILYVVDAAVLQATVTNGLLVEVQLHSQIKNIPEYIEGNIKLTSPDDIIINNDGYISDIVRIPNCADDEALMHICELNYTYRVARLEAQQG